MEAAKPKITKAKTEKQLKKEAKMAKFLEKQKGKVSSSASTEQLDSKKVTDYVQVEKYVNLTPRGEKKVFGDFQQKYDPEAVESAWMDWWSKSGFFKPECNPGGKPYVITFPPPNVTGRLHIGHALTTAVQDALIRYHRMRGYSVLYLPGCDHAGIATQSVVEKQLLKSENKTRHDLGRTEFLKRVWDWKNENGNGIYDQMKRLGGSFDWDRVVFTMDDKMINAVNQAFIQGHAKGLIYRDTKLVNWCCTLNTALSNLEVDQKEIKVKTMLPVPGHDPKKKYIFGVLVYFNYPVCNKDGSLTGDLLTIATTRIETMLGDSAVCVNPNDSRFVKYHSLFVKHPFTNKCLPIIQDEYVDVDFGTGVVKMTPAHDINDYEIGKRHGLEFIDILNDDGSINENGGKFSNLMRFDAREAILKDLKDLNLFVEIKDHVMVVPVCSRSGDIIEPRLKPQWWMNCNLMAKRAVEAVNSKNLLIQPEQSEKEWHRWLNNIQDWCLSRQLWWGHKVPAYLVSVNNLPLDGNDGNNWIIADSYDSALDKAKVKFKHLGSISIQQDEDVLDTWFSSSLWPFATMGWPESTNDFVNYYPNALLETGKDILFFWVARMVMMGLLLTDKVPFERVFCHAMVRDAQGRKMSKSLGNVVDPVDVIQGITLEELQLKLMKSNLSKQEIEKASKGQQESYPSGIPQCGTDALRFALCSLTNDGNSINLDILRVEGYRKFCNKMWNAIKFGMMKLDAKQTINKCLPVTLPEKWILSKLAIAAKDVETHLNNYNFMQATNCIYKYFLNELCDVFIESTKALLESSPQEADSTRNTLYLTLDGALKLFHPFMPFVTEELWQRLPRQAGDAASICISKYPEFDDYYYNLEEMESFECVIKVISVIRSLMVLYSVASKAKGNQC
eukprot:NODE_35_length_31537_cov_0.293403.p2 type:complete len:900 gc:universal NODE_35_length_31537_cov_0.293403:12401-9702(-)